MKDRFANPPDEEVASFDVFDTVVTRNVFHPLDLHARVERGLKQREDLLPGRELGFPALRRAAELRARENLHGREEVTLGEIVALLAQDLWGSGKNAAILAVLEIDEELNASVPVRSTLNLISQMRRAGKKIVYISDMYLPEEVVREMLQRAGALEPGDRVFLSGVLGQKKSTGSLFRVVLKDLGINPRQMVHFGDYIWSDYLVPRFKCGIRSFSVRSARYNTYERLWGDRCRCPFCSSVAGASRAARVARLDTGSAEERALYGIGCNVIGPILVGFVLWTLRHAVQAGITRLYFLSRDGEVIWDIARELAKRLDIGIELRYLYVSRTAVFPALPGTGVNVRTIEWIKEKTILLTPRIIADRLKLDPDDLYEQLLRVGVNMNGLDSLLDGKTVDSVGDLLVTDPILKEMLAVRSGEIMLSLAGYLQQEGMFDGASPGLVDLGWHGGIQDVIHACFKERLGANGISGYYFGVDLAGEPDTRKNGYFFSHDEPSGIDRYRDLFRVLLELMCSGSHGMVRGYSVDAQGRHVPVCCMPEHPGNWGRIQYIREGIVTFLGNLDSSSIKESDYQHVRPQMLGVLKKLFFYPNRTEAVALGDLRFSADQAGHGVHRVAPPFSVGSAIRFFSKRSYASRSTLSSWFFASWSRSAGCTRFLLYPVVAILRISYVGTDVWKFSWLSAVDLVNRAMCINKISGSGGDDVY